ncbi:hypothetical protein L9F63_007991, partial [Diploptera punctata]
NPTLNRQLSTCLPPKISITDSHLNIFHVLNKDLLHTFNCVSDSPLCDQFIAQGSPHLSHTQSDVPKLVPS